MEDYKILVKKKLECGWTLYIAEERYPEEPTPFHCVWIENTVGTRLHDIDIENSIDMKNVGEAFLKAYERRKRK